MDNLIYFKGEQDSSPFTPPLEVVEVEGIKINDGFPLLIVRKEYTLTVSQNGNYQIHSDLDEVSFTYKMSDGSEYTICLKN